MTDLSFIDPHITVGTLLEIGTIVVGGVIALSKFATKFALFHADLTGVKTDMTDMKSEIKKVNELLASAREADRRITRLEDDLRELRHGEGFVTGNRRAGTDGVY